MRRGTLVFAGCIATITAVAVIVLVARDTPRVPAPQPGAQRVRTAPSATVERKTQRKAERPEIERADGDRRDRRDERSGTTGRSNGARMARGVKEADRMRREALRRHAERMRADQELRRPEGPDCEVPDAFDVPGCASP